MAPRGCRRADPERPPDLVGIPRLRTAVTKVGEAGSDSRTDTTYYRGMGGRSPQVRVPHRPTRTPSPVWSGDNSVRRDHRQASSRTVNEAWQSAPTATRTISGNTEYARHLGTRTTYQQIALDGGRGSRTTKTVADFDSYGMVDQVDDSGDTGKTGDKQCTTTTFDRNTSANILATVGRVLTAALPCGTDPAGPDDVISDQRTSFDNQDTVPLLPLVTRPAPRWPKNWGLNGARLPDDGSLERRRVRTDRRFVGRERRQDTHRLHPGDRWPCHQGRVDQPDGLDIDHGAEYT